MLVSPVILVACGAGVGLGLVLILPWPAPGRDRPEPRRLSAGSARDKAARRGRRIGLGIAAGGITLLVTRWPAAALVALAFGLAAPALGGASEGLERLEAIAVWTEMLRDSLGSSSGLSQSIMVTAPLAPRALAVEVASLAARLRAGVPSRVALRNFADQIADPTADVVVAALILAATERAQHLPDLLSELAIGARAEVSMRLGVEASRSSARTAVRTIVVFSLSFFALLAVLARSYLSPLSTAQGQGVLLLVGLLFGWGLLLMTRMLRPEVVPRLFGRFDGGREL
jgi:tight adherence protein B